MVIALLLGVWYCKELFIATPAVMVIALLLGVWYCKELFIVLIVRSERLKITLGLEACLLPALAIVFRADAETFIKNAAEITGIPEADLVGDLANVQIGMHQEVFGSMQFDGTDKEGGRKPGPFLEFVVYLGTACPGVPAELIDTVCFVIDVRFDQFSDTCHEMNVRPRSHLPFHAQDRSSRFTGYIWFVWCGGAELPVLFYHRM